MVHRGVGVALVGVVWAALVTQSRALGAGAEVDADKLIRQGIELRKAHDDEGAAREFQKAYDLVHTPKAAAQLGLAEQALGRWEDAERHVGEALRATADPWIAKNRLTLENAVVTIQDHVGRVEVLGDPEGAEVSVNGRSVGKLPLPDAVRVSAGEVDVEMRAPGYAPAQRTLTIVGGQYQRLVLHLNREAASAEGPPSGPKAGGGDAPGAAPTPTMPPQPKAPSADEPSHVRVVLKWSAAGAAGVGLAVGVIASVLHGNNVSAFDQHTPACADNNGMAVHFDASPAKECQGELDAYRSDRTWQIVGFVGAGAFAATWLVLQLTEPAAPAAEQHALAIPACAPSLSSLGLFCEGRF